MSKLLTTSDRPYRICSRCVMDTSDPHIVFDDGGCNHCRRYDRRIAEEVHRGADGARQIERIVEVIRAEGRGKPYDCIAGVSGGVDSTYVLYKLKELGLRPLAVHFDNGWNSEVAVSNIKSTLSRLKVDLFTYVVDWEEFRDLQLSFIKASVPNCEIPTDHAITATLVKTAQKYNVHYVVNGSNVTTEGILPLAWVYYSHDLRHIKALHRRFGTVPMRTFPQLSLYKFAALLAARRYRVFNLLNYLDYDKTQAVETIKSEVGWQPYGHKHYESIYTRFYQGYYLVKKFGFDKRRAHLSALVCAGQLTRDEALRTLQEDPYAGQDLSVDYDFVVKKLGISPDEFQGYVAAQNKQHTDYPNDLAFIRRFGTLAEWTKRRAKTV